ncbi:hypothetical protein GCM10023114_01410 [Mycolicibacterium sediminis]|uniref:LGFP repeat-containing protein n=2 Tax=Mycolicibacterium sediminis TaxID=1286180 RepID=A0A7I7QT52_9MYCO|nr:hypothetical protein MSEDJ_35670 [Mycolicibacterium sediminis]
MGRASAAVFIAAAVVALAPMVPLASAAPDGDADVAMTQAWEAGGGATGPLGPKDGGVYPVGAGFGQNFAGGRIFFTPDTGARIMQGAILDKYLALGGPGDGDLGFPNIDEGPGRAPGSRNTTFSAADKPVIFWTPDTGAHVVRGAINAAWDRLGGSAAVLGVPTEDEVYRGDVVSQTFTGGELSWNRVTKAFTSTPPELAGQLDGLEIPGDATSAIAAARRAAGGPLGPLGAAQGPPTSVGDDGLEQTFAGGKIFYSPGTGAAVITGQVLAKYESVGGPGGDLGFPTADEADGGLAPASRFATFAAEDEPVIFWTPDFGAMIVRGPMNAAWTKLGGAEGDLGAPTADQTDDGDVVTQTFANGAISWNRASGEFTTEPPALASQLSGLDVPGQNAPQAPQTSAGTDSADDQKWYRQWWWLLAVVPVLVLVGAVVAAVVLNRRRRDDREPLNTFDDYDEYDDDDEDDGEFDSGPVPVGDQPRVNQPPYVPLSAWAMPNEEERPAGPVDAPDAGRVPDAFADDQDAIDTTPTRVVTADELANANAASDDSPPEPSGLAASVIAPTPEHEPEPASREDPTTSEDLTGGPPSGRHAAISRDATSPSQTSLLLAMNNPFDAPDGYPIKADTRTGLYFLPESPEYDRVRAEIWFASEEFALTNGFTRG